MQEITIITGGAGGMGLATAKAIGRDHHIVLGDVNPDRLKPIVVELSQLGVRADAAVCDVSDRASVDALFDHAARLGHVASVVHTAGLSPRMADSATIMKVNALGTIHVTEAALAVASQGFALVNVASVAAHLLPSVLLPKRAYIRALSDPAVFLDKAVRLCRFLPREHYRTGMAYAISKNFVVWYSQRLAAKFGQKGARILSVSPGAFDTQMGRLEQDDFAPLLKRAALKRPGRPEEVAELLAFCASPKAGYLTGADILCDGGVTASRV